MRRGLVVKNLEDQMGGIGNQLVVAIDSGGCVNVVTPVGRGEGVWNPEGAVVVSGGVVSVSRVQLQQLLGGICQTPACTASSTRSRF